MGTILKVTCKAIAVEGHRGTFDVSVDGERVRSRSGHRRREW
jgi:hypothetical protein